MTGNGDIANGAEGVLAEQHLSDDELNSLIDGALLPAERERAERHLASCGACRVSLMQFRAIAEALAAVPVARVPRSFQLGPEFAREGGSWWSRLAAVLMPMLPAMRAATVALALILFGSTAYRALDDTSGPDRVTDGIEAPQASLTAAAPTEAILAQATQTQVDTANKTQAPDPTQPEEEAADIFAAEAADEESAGDSAPAAGDAARQDGPETGTSASDSDEAVAEEGDTSIAMSIEAAVASSPDPALPIAPTATATATATVTATPEPTAPSNEVDLRDDVSRDDREEWVEWVQLGSGAALLAMLALWAGLVVSRRRAIR